MQLRFAVPSDAGALLRIYDEYINTSITFEDALPGEAEFAARIADISAEYPYLAVSYTHLYAVSFAQFLCELPKGKNSACICQFLTI